MSACGRKRPVNSAHFRVSERPLSGQADVRRLTGTVLHINARFRVNAPPLPNKTRRARFFGVRRFLLVMSKVWSQSAPTGEPLARIGALRQRAVAVGPCLYRRWSEELRRALVLCPARSSRTIIGSWWPCAASLSIQASARRAAWRRFECFPLCCFFKRTLASRNMEEAHVE